MYPVIHREAFMNDYFFPHPAISVTKKRNVMLDSSLPVYFCYRLMETHSLHQAALHISNFRFIFLTHHFFQILLRTGAKEKDTRRTASGTITWNATTASSNTSTKGFNHLTPNCCEESSNTKLQNLPFFECPSDVILYCVSHE